MATINNHAPLAADGILETLHGLTCKVGINDETTRKPCNVWAIAAPLYDSLPVFGCETMYNIPQIREYKVCLRKKDK